MATWTESEAGAESDTVLDHGESEGPQRVMPGGERCLHYDSRADRRSAECFTAQLRMAKKTPGPNDLLLAATAYVHGLSLATLNVKHFAELGGELVKS